jgi:methionine--tRNA ligase beta chain
MKKEKITFEEFIDISDKLEIKLGLITDVVRVEKSTKLLKLTVDFGSTTNIVVTNIGGSIDDIDSLKGQSYPFVTNLVPSKIMGIVSEAMILPLNTDGVYSGISSAGCGAIII